MKQVVITHGYYQPYFYWMFPIVVAREEGLFEKEGVDLRVHDIVTGGQPEDKASWYKEALEKNSRDFYFCCAWQGIYSTSETGKGKIGAALKSTLIKTFGIYSRPDTGFENILDLVESGKPIAVNKNADAHYVTLRNLAEFVPESKVNLTHLGGVERCFKALMAKGVDAATLAGPYAEAAEAIGFKNLLPLSRTEPTVVVFDDDLGMEAVEKFVAGINGAVRLINTDRPKYAARYKTEFRQVVERYLPELSGKLNDIMPWISLPVWQDAKPMGKEEFDGVRNFLLEHGLSSAGKGYEGSVTVPQALQGPS
ncbi:MAG TPA: hypothetical protein VGR56_05165 [Nitrososphaerales archaeon]|nr:hypothetical protein [Nitrososphaerales archaeon]